MAARETAAQAGYALNSLRASPAVQRFIQDAEVRQNIRDAYGLSRNAYGRLTNGKPALQALVDDRKLQKELRDAALLVGASATALREGPRRKRKKRHLGRKLLVVIAGAGLALALSENLRKMVLDALFGAEEEFDYTSTTVPTPAPDPVNAA